VAAGGVTERIPRWDQPPTLAATVRDMSDDRTRCDSCGDDAVDVVAVRRAYVTPGAWDTEAKVDVLDDVERWCFPCRTHYPHELVEPR
jgi:hypothetical protein